MSDPQAEPTRRIVRVRRTGPLVAGIVAIVIGLVVLLIGVAAVLAGDQALQVAAAEDRARVGNGATFDASERRYAIVLTPDPGTGDFVESRVARLMCQVRHPDGAIENLDPGFTSSRTTSSAGTFVADFEGRGGETTVTCRWGDAENLGGFFSVGRSSETVQIGGTIALAVGGLIGLVGAGLVIIGVKGRTEIQAIDQTGPSDTGPDPA